MVNTVDIHKVYIMVNGCPSVITSPNAYSWWLNAVVLVAVILLRKGAMPVAMADSLSVPIL